MGISPPWSEPYFKTIYDQQTLTTKPWPPNLHIIIIKQPNLRRKR